MEEGGGVAGWRGGREGGEWKGGGGGGEEEFEWHKKWNKSGQIKEKKREKSMK